MGSLKVMNFTTINWSSYGDCLFTFSVNTELDPIIHCYTALTVEEKNTNY